MTDERRRKRRQSSSPPPTFPGPANSAEPPRRNNTPKVFPIRLVDVLLYDAHVQRFPNNYSKIDTTQEPQAHINANTLRPAIEDTRMEIGLNITVLLPSAETPLFSLTATVNGVFELPPNTDPALVQQFSESSAMFLIWPYARELFENLSLRMRLPIVVLPTLDTGVATKTVSSEETHTTATDPQSDEATE